MNDDFPLADENIAKLRAHLQAPCEAGQHFDKLCCAVMLLADMILEDVQKDRAEQKK
jgi:hypothetical protein